MINVKIRRLVEQGMDTARDAVEAPFVLKRHGE